MQNSTVSPLGTQRLINHGQLMNHSALIRLKLNINVRLSAEIRLPQGMSVGEKHALHFVQILEIPKSVVRHFHRSGIRVK